MTKIIKTTCEDQVRVAQIEDIQEFLEKTYEKKFFYKPMVEIDYPEKTKLLSVFSIYENLDKIEFSNEKETEEDFVIYEKNGNKNLKTKDSLENCELIICRPLMENKDLINIETIKLLPIEIETYFRTNIKRQLTIELPDINETSENRKKYENIKYLINFVPNKIINMENVPYTRIIRENNQIRYKFIDGKDHSEKDNSIYDSRKIRVLDKDIFNIEDYIFLKTFNNNLLMLNKNNEQK